MTMQPECAIWGTPAGAKLPDGRNRRIQIHESERAGGSYSIDMIVADRAIPQLDDATKARLTTYLVRSRQRGDEFPNIGGREVDDARAAEPTPVHERAVSLLNYIARQSDRIGKNVGLGTIMPGALAWSESTTREEVSFLIKYLGSQELVLLYANQGIVDNFTVTVEGYSRLETEDTTSMPYQAFVAMWFHESMEGAYEHGIRSAIKDVGYEAFRVDRAQNIGKIDDQIIREIRRSRFVVADFTQGEDGNRGSVYYEAGFARGHGVAVISTCHADQISDLAFDTRQYAHIPWTDPEGLRVELAARIGALFGEGKQLNY